MLIVSSYRPFEPYNLYKDIQIRAKNSWDGYFSEIIYCGEAPLPKELATDKTKLIEVENFPPIRFLASIAALGSSKFSCIANSDIEIDTVKLTRAMEVMEKAGVVCATSRRWTYYGDDKKEAMVITGDFGLDIFICKPHIWQDVADNIPEKFYIGHNGWDTWMLRHLSGRFGHSFRNFTDFKCVFHPLHKRFSDRNKPVQPIETSVGKEPHILEL